MNMKTRTSTAMKMVAIAAVGSAVSIFAAPVVNAQSLAALAGGTTSIISEETRWCVTSSGPQDNLPVSMSNCDGSQNQRWAFDFMSFGSGGSPMLYYYRMRNPGTGMCVSLETGSNANGIRMVQRPCDNSDAQQFHLRYLPNKKGREIVNKATAKCFASEPWATTIVQYSCGSRANFRFVIDPLIQHFY